MDTSHISPQFISQLKRHILHSRYTVAKIANAEMLRLYFVIGFIIEAEFAQRKWGAKVVDDISNRLQAEMPGLRGFSGKNIEKMRSFFNAWKYEALNDPTQRTLVVDTDEKIHNLIYSSVTSKLHNESSIPDFVKDNDLKERILDAFFSISFTHHYEVITKVKTLADRWYYIDKTAKNLWTVRHLRTELANKSHLREQNFPNNFSEVMPPKMLSKAVRVFKDQYLLDFVNVEDADDEIDERVLEQQIVQNIRKFLMSLGSDFSFMGNQYRLVVEENEYFVDLLFFHRELQALVAFELKKGKFKPEYVGKMNFYLSALDDLVKKSHKNPSIGIILCKEKENKTVEYSFRDVSKPLGVSVYKTSDTLPPQLKYALPDAETLKKLLD